MKFCSRKVLEYLKNPKDMLVATMRDWRYKRDQRVVLRDCKGRIIGYGIVAEVAPADEEKLRKWLPYSGFSSVEEWVEEAVRLSGKKPKFVYLIYIVGRR